MSKFRVHESKIRLQAAIIEALADIVAKRRHISMESALEIVHEKVEFHHEPVNLYGYQHDIRDEKANIVCRRDFVRNYLGGGASNDAGFLLSKDGSYEAIISAYDEAKWWNNASPRFWQVAMAQEAILEAKSAGYILHKTEKNQQIQLEAVMVGTGQGSHSGSGW